MLIALFVLFYALVFLILSGLSGEARPKPGGLVLLALLSSLQCNWHPSSF
jgi:hypothetical protein